MDILAKIKRKIGTRRIFYVCRDIERAGIGLRLNIPGYFVITNESAYARTLHAKYPNVLLVKDSRALDTLQLLKHEICRENIKPKDYILVFKANKPMEQLCRENKWLLLNPSAELSNRVEEKISQVEWLGPLKKYLPPHQIGALKEITWNGVPFILQFNRAHTGIGTILIKTKKQLEELKRKFPERLARTTRYIDGPSFTNNNVIWGKDILSGSINYQITGLRPFTDNPFATIGNDWGLSNALLTKTQIKQFNTIAQTVGKRLLKSGWRGLFGIDAVLDRKNGKIFLIEINARQLASVPFESEMQSALCHSHAGGNDNVTTTFAAHLAALLGIARAGCGLTPIADGAQIILRNQKINHPTKTERLKNFHLISYDHSEIGADRLRIQSPVGVMTTHNKFNKIGKIILQAVNIY